MKKRSLFAAAVAATASAVLLAGCSSPASDPAPTDGSGSVELTKDVTLVVGTSNQEGAFFEESGLFEDVPYTIEWSYITDWGAIYSSIASDALNVGYWGLDSNAVKAVQNGVGAKFVSLLGAQDEAAAESGTLNVFVRSDAGIETTADLAGAKIATGSAGTTFDNILNGALLDGGLSEDDVEVIRYPDADQTSQISALLNGEVEAFAGNIASEQIVGALEDGTIEVLFWENQFSPVNRLVVSNEQTLSDPAKEAALEDFVQRVAETAYWKADPANEQTYAEILNSVGNLPVDVGQKVWGYTQNATLPLQLDATTEQNLAQTIADYQAAGYIDEPLPVEEILDTRFADAVAEVIGAH
ncbi:ABC transporter substrate-binding protein [Leucobacter weissii]|uniref:ABC transporter substrate-binding protein n=1 Tax=Leucobacter weissii TaxID=1983706 RepID=A0A939MRP8_9MICO|nr:ABC transporter substrate-binding protein [Leucobacter weissii]MBO1901774.1 ABC transporter substrate-binding protein [Leucobacter weissii]